MYYRRPQRKNILSYLLPFLIIVLIFTAVILGWRTLDNIFVESNRNTLNEKVTLSIEEGGAKAMLVGKGEWQEAPDKLPLYRGDRLKTGSDGRVALTVFDQSIMRVNTNTEVTFTTLKKKNDAYDIEVELVKGDVWSEVERITNPNSNFSITTDLLTVDTRGAIVAISTPGTVYMIEGTAQIGVKYDDKVIKTYNLGVGQQFMISSESLNSIKKGENAEVIFMLSDEFKQSKWYYWNKKRDGAINAFEKSDLEEETEEDFDGETIESEDLANIGRVVYVTKPSKNTETNKSTINIEGRFDPEKINAVFINGEKADIFSEGHWKMNSVKLDFEGENEIKIEAEDLNGNKQSLDPLVIIYDKTAPTRPVITEPEAQEGGGAITIEDVEQVISGTVSKDTATVIVNDYRLTKYVPGSKEFQYFAKTEIGNLEVGENEYKVYAEDKSGNASEPGIIILNLDQEVVDAADEEDVETQDPASTDDEPAAALPQASSTGGVKITAPNNGESLETTETEFEILGTVPEGTAKVIVNGYTLTSFEAGDTTFKYRAFVSIGNLKIGEKNTYTAKAYDEENKLLGQASIVIDVESGSSAAPVITIPSDTGSYSTTLDTVVVGGDIGKWVTRVYVNDKEITDYIPGSEKFRMSVKLDPGKNTFVVNAEKAGVPVGKAQIEITYQQ